MRLAALGDIHGNAAALQAVLSGAVREGAQALLITGDYVGYYYRPAEALAMLEGWTQWSISGNHERMLFDSHRDSVHLARCVRKYGSGLAVALDTLTTAQIGMLTSLPQTQRLEFDGVRVLLAHGTPWEPDEYLYPDAAEAKWVALLRSDADIIVLGHTHYRLVRQYDGCLVLNPGSVGQPRDFGPGASWALVDTESRTARLFSEEYNSSAVADEARRRDPEHPYLHEVLCRVSAPS